MGGNPDYFEALASEPETRVHLVSFVGGTAAITKRTGKGMATTWISTGVVDLDFSGNANNPGEFVGFVATFQATTPGDVKNYVVVPGVYNSSTKKLRLSLYESGTLTDLAALEWLNCAVIFRVAAGTF